MKQTVKYILRAVLLIFLVSIVIMIAWVMFFIVAGPFLVDTITPPEYPNSVLVNAYKPVTNGAPREIKEYATTDSITDVLDFMGDYMPPFEQINNASVQNYYVSRLCNENSVAKYYSRAHQGVLPCISVGIYIMDLNDKQQTGIRVVRIWATN